VDKGEKIVITGAAGLVGQNLVQRLQGAGYRNILGIDKQPNNTRTLRDLNPALTIVEADLAADDSWADHFENAGAVVLNHAQIGALTEGPFVANNLTATERVLAAAKKHNVPYIVHISSSVVNSAARDYYTETKKAQEALVVKSGIPCCILRPTLMFGWFDRKHLGWLARFMKRVPVFPVPGDGQYIRQPLYVGDFCNIIISALGNPRPGVAYNISGRTRIAFIDLMREVRAAIGAHAAIVRIPYGVFWALLSTYAVFDRNPPFTTKQLEALVTPDEFEVIDWPGIFNVSATPLSEALNETFRDPLNSKIVLEF
jgi:nucleoside-diphosphate-sugar epimerase